MRHTIGRLLGRRFRDERGAVAVVVAVAMVALLGFTAVSVDVGAMYAERAQLQSAADAAAIAVAQDCAAGRPCTVDAAKPVAKALANANANDGAANISALDFPDAHSVHVTTSTRDAGTGAGRLALVFAPLLGIDDPTLVAEATASWGSPARGPAVLPVAFAPCAFRLDGVIQVLQVHGSGGNTCSGYHSPSSGSELPGGFGWLADPSGTCSAQVDIAQIAPSGTGNNLTAQCASVLMAAKNTTVIVPVFGDTGGSGTNGWFKITGWAAFTLLGWNFPGNNQYNNNTYEGAKCKNSCTGLIGRFEKFVSLDDRFTPGGPNLGTSIVRLTK